ncbi:molybdopterin biosynthesis protein MoeB [Burkholderia sp. MS455]|uniref:ThiF family adenylyltransferase n=1 Tax=Burkholderia sp. MS455 TaxID=2811788 RepID=UPI0019594C22|nr:ThiF family adenylyltransferase [Burkholderia sp. MS455]QRR07541.1 molybdopterin biosynthesis protein MoeB [Burkholderia sp. MS455]
MPSKRFSDYLTTIRQTAREIPVEVAKTLLKEAVPFFDVREESEIGDGLIPNAHAPGRSFLEITVAEQVSDLNAPIVLYCASGVRSLMAVASLHGLGYSNVVSLTGGFAAWKAAGLPIERSSALSMVERKRYERQLILPQVGPSGQGKLHQAKVLVIGAGGLGSSCLQYLAAAGVGQIGIIDHDRVDLGNLQRQVIYSVGDIGKLKASAAADALRSLNPEIHVQAFTERLATANASRICSSFDILVDCTDNFTARYLINDTAVAIHCPVVQGAVFRFEGHVYLLNHRGGPCYRCLYPESPPTDIAPTCSEAGVIGVVPGLIGVLQAAKVIKLILGVGTNSNTALVYHALEDRFSERKLQRRTSCACTGVHPAMQAHPATFHMESNP